jgi:GNAT superfamily N-acetyltransferase
MTKVRMPPRAATVADIPAIARVAAASDEPIDSPGVPGSPYAEHLLARGTVVVAETDDGVVVGYVSAVTIGSWRHVTDLFVHPASRDRGIGSALLAAALDGTGAATAFSSEDPRALPLFVRAGLRALWPNLYLEGRPGRLPDPELEVRLATADEAGAAELDLSGFDRARDHAYWGSRRGATPFIVVDGSTVLGAGVAVHRRGRPGRWLPHLAIAPGADAAAVALAALHATAPGGVIGPPPEPDRPTGPASAHPPTSVCVPGPHPVLPLLLRFGFRIVDRDLFTATDPGLVDPERLLPDPSLL